MLIHIYVKDTRYRILWSEISHYYVSIVNFRSLRSVTTHWAAMNDENQT